MSVGHDLYLSSEGQDTGATCSQIEPCKTIQYAVSRAQSGDTVHIHSNPGNISNATKNVRVGRQAHKIC